MAETEIGKVAHYFDKIGVAAIEMSKGKLAVGDTIRIKGQTSDITLTVESMQIEHETVDKVKKGDSVGIAVPEKVREHDTVFKVTD